MAVATLCGFGAAAFYAAPSAQTPPAAQARGGAATQIPRLANGKPNLNGVWQALNAAEWNIQDHGPALDTPGGQGVVDGNELPYRPEALTKRNENFAKHAELDLTTSRCYMPGVPRATYMPFPLEVAQDDRNIAIRYEFAHAYRLVPLNSKRPDLSGWPDFWMGDSRGSWDGDTLVVDVVKIDDRTWFDRAGNFHSDALHVVERYSFIDRDHLLYEVTIEDPKVFVRPWKMSMPLYRRIEKNPRILEYDCAWFKNEEKYKTPSRR